MDRTAAYGSGSRAADIHLSSGPNSSRSNYDFSMQSNLAEAGLLGRICVWASITVQGEDPGGLYAAGASLLRAIYSAMNDSSCSVLPPFFSGSNDLPAKLSELQP